MLFGQAWPIYNNNHTRKSDNNNQMRSISPHAENDSSVGFSFVGFSFDAIAVAVNLKWVKKILADHF